MPGCLIESVHDGMNLRDPAAAIAPGEIQESVGIDFSVSGQVKPMRAPLLTLTLPYDILDSHIVYLAEVKYTFTTHVDGLRVTTARLAPLSGDVTNLIDAAFTGTFKILPLNDEYVVLASATMNRKWKPGWTTTYQWGLNTPPLPAVSAGAPITKVIEDFESLAATGSPWTITGGGSSAAIAADTVNFKDGTQSMKLTCDAQTTIIAKRTNLALDLSQFAIANDAGAAPYMAFSFFAADLATVNSLKIKLSCAANGGFDKDYFQMVVSLGGYAYAQWSPTGQGVISSVDMSIDPSLQPGAQRTVYDPSTNTLNTYVLTEDTLFGPPSYRWFLQNSVEQPTNVQQVNITAVKRGGLVSSNGWNDLKMLFSDFVRVGATAGRGWNTITAISIELEASATQSIVSFDAWDMMGGGELWGDYAVAVAYQNDQGNYGPFTDFTPTVHLEAQPLEVSGLTPDTDPQTTQRRFAIIGGSISQPMITFLGDNTASTFLYNELDSALTTIEAYFNNKQPPVGIVDMATIQGRIFLVMGDNTLRFSLPLLYEAFPLAGSINLAEGEQFMQVAASGPYVAARGKGREYLVQLTGTDPAFWQPATGAKEGAVSSRFLIEDFAGVQVWPSKHGFYATPGYYLPKIDPAVADFSQVFGAMAGKKAYLAFTDTGGTARVMRIDYTLNRPVAHYVANFTPTAIFADQILGKVYYSLGPNIYEFDAGPTPLATSLKIPEQLCKTATLKSFIGLSYELEGNDLTLALSVERQAVAGTITLVAKDRTDAASDFPDGTIGGQLGMTLTATGDFVMYLPLEVEFCQA